MTLYNELLPFGQPGLDAWLAQTLGAYNFEAPWSDLGISIDLKSADKDLKAMTSEKSKTCVTAFTKKLVTIFQLSRPRKGHFFLKSAKLEKCFML